MKNSTVLLVFGVLGLGGVGAYLYLKNKKASTLGSVADDTLGLAPSTSTTPPSTTETPPKATIDTVVSAFAETQTENYKKAKILSKDVEAMGNTLISLTNQYNQTPITNIGNQFSIFTQSPTYIRLTLKSKIERVKKEMQEKTVQANALGYKILPYGEIEKM